MELDRTETKEVSNLAEALEMEVEGSLDEVEGEGEGIF